MYVYISKKTKDKLIDGIDPRLQGNREGVMMFNTTFNNISAMSWQSVLMVV